MPNSNYWKYPNSAQIMPMFVRIPVLMVMHSTSSNTQLCTNLHKFMHNSGYFFTLQWCRKCGSHFITQAQNGQTHFLQEKGKQNLGIRQERRDCQKWKNELVFFHILSKRLRPDELFHDHCLLGSGRYRVKILIACLLDWLISPLFPIARL